VVEADFQDLADLSLDTDETRSTDLVLELVSAPISIRELDQGKLGFAAVGVRLDDWSPILPVVTMPPLMGCWRVQRYNPAPTQTTPARTRNAMSAPRGARKTTLTLFRPLALPSAEPVLRPITTRPLR
jgi:hypothetical protein